MIKKGCLLGALFTVSLLVAAADPPAKKPAVPARADIGDAEAWRSVPANRPFNALVTCTAPSGGRCRITVTMGEVCDTNQKPKDEIARVKKNVTIRWELDQQTAAKWRFDNNDGVKFVDPLAPFDAKAAGTNAFHWHVKANAAPGIYDYTIKLVASNGSVCLIDPAIWI